VIARGLLLVTLTACSFHSGPGGAAADGPPATGDAARDAAIGEIDAPPDAAPDAYVCTTALLTCAGIAAVHDCGGTCWVSCSEGVEQPVAAARCTAWGGRLAPLQTAADHDCVRLTIFPGTAAWTGFAQLADQGAANTGWSWNGDGAMPAFTSWAPGQPNDGDGVENNAEQCAYLSTPSGMWQDEPCTNASRFRFACRRGP
jgi:hypothetical protein